MESFSEANAQKKKQKKRGGRKKKVPSSSASHQSSNNTSGSNSLNTSAEISLPSDTDLVDNTLQNSILNSLDQHSTHRTTNPNDSKSNHPPNALLLSTSALIDLIEDDWLKLNVGGKRMTVPRSTLTKEKDSVLFAMFNKK